MPIPELATKPLPKMISPKVHAIIDWSTTAALVAAGAVLWKKNKRAAIASFVCADLIGTAIALTDCPGGLWKKISFEAHGKIDPGVAGLASLMPNLMGFSDQTESKLFQSIGIGLAAVRNLTDFKEGSNKAERRMKAA